MYFPDTGCVRPFRHLYGYAAAVNLLITMHHKLKNTVFDGDRRQFEMSVKLYCRFPAGVQDSFGVYRSSTQPN